MRLRDVVLFNLTAIVGLRWLTTAAQFGPASLLLWVLAMVFFFLPSAVAVRELTDIDPRAGGIYRWVSRALGPRHGFLAGWGYWVNNLLYFPSLLLATAATIAYVGGPSTVHLQDNSIFVGSVSLVCLWIAVWLNVVGLRVGKWLQNFGGHGAWIPALIFVALAAWSFVERGSATSFTTGRLLPAKFDFQLDQLFRHDDLRVRWARAGPLTGRRGPGPGGDAAARRGRFGVRHRGHVRPRHAGDAGGAACGAGQHHERDAAGHRRAGRGVGAHGAPAPRRRRRRPDVPWATWGAWGRGSRDARACRSRRGWTRRSRRAFARVHPRWQTPYVALLVQGALATVFVVAGLAGATVRDAYVTLTSTTIILFFVPYLYIFAAYLRLRRERTLRTTLVGWSGMAAVALSIALSLVPPAVEQPWVFEAKVVGGTVVFLGVGLVVVAAAV